jgi:hypothetical protein
MTSTGIPALNITPTVVGPTQAIPTTSAYHQIVMGLQAAVAIGIFAAIVLFSVFPAHAASMTINPDADLDTTQVVDHRDADPDTFYLVLNEDAPDAVADCLTELGWRGKFDDGMPAIYAPTVVIRDCGGDVSVQPR